MMFDPDVARSLQKPVKRRSVVKRERRAQHKLTRAQVIAEVWRRDCGLCQRCGKRCVKPRETYPTDPDRGEHQQPGYEGDAFVLV